MQEMFDKLNYILVETISTYVWYALNMSIYSAVYIFLIIFSLFRAICKYLLQWWIIISSRIFIWTVINLLQRISCSRIMGITFLARAWREVNYKFHISRSNSTILKSNLKLFWNERVIYDMANRKEGGKGQEERKRNRVTTRPRIETNYACGSNLRRRKYASNAFKVNCISLCRARIVCSSPRRVTMHNTRKSAHHTSTHILRARRTTKNEGKREKGGKNGRMGEKASDGAR